MTSAQEIEVCDVCHEPVMPDTDPRGAVYCIGSTLFRPCGELMAPAYAESGALAGHVCIGCGYFHALHGELEALLDRI